MFARYHLSPLFAEKLFKICPLIQITARSVGRISLYFLTQLGYKSFWFRLVVYKQIDSYTTKFLYARSTTRTKDLKNPQGSLHNLFCLCNRQGNPTVECTVKKVLSGIPPSCKRHFISSSLWALFMCQCISVGRPAL